MPHQDQAQDPAQTGIEIVYDGECPFCSAYARMLNLRAAVGPVALIDARSEDPRAAALKAARIDLDEGMAVTYGGRLYHGAEAVSLLSMLSASWGPLRALMRSPRRAALIYPLMNFGRKLTLRLLGRRLIG